MDVVIYKAKGKNGYLYDMSLNPYVDLEVLRNTRKVKSVQVLSPKIPLQAAEGILKRIYGGTFLAKFANSHDYFIKKELKKLKIKQEVYHIDSGISLASAENISMIEECIMGKVITVRRLLKIAYSFGLTEEDMLNIIQLLYCERRIRMVPAVRKIRNKAVCSFCEKEECSKCCLGFEETDIILYAADNYNIGVPRKVNYKRKKLNDCLNKAFEGVSYFSSTSKKNSAILWCVPGGFDYAVLSEGLANMIMSGGRVLYITSGTLLHEVERELSNIIEDAKIAVADDNDFKFKYNDISICSYNDYPCFHKAFDLVIFDERMSFVDRPLKNMFAISKRAVKEKGKILNITCFPEIKRYKRGGHSPELVTIPVTYTRSPIPEPLIVISRILKESLPQLIIDTIKWSVYDNFKMIIFVPNEEIGINIYNDILENTDINKEAIDFSSVRDKTSIIRLKRKEIQVLISSDIKDANCIIEDLNVLVVNAENDIYSKETLMYMAAMAEFHTKKKCGQVIFAVERDSDEVTITKDRIRGINKIAWESGYIKK